MSDCSSIDSLVTPYVDGELSIADQEAVAEHLARCRSCAVRVGAERAARNVVRASKTVLQDLRAPDDLRSKCAALARLSESPDVNAYSADVAHASRPARTVVRSPWMARLTPFALAAALVLIVGGAFVYRLTETSAQLMAAELAADHAKCFALNGLLGTHQSAAAVESSLASSFGWPMRLADTEGAGLELVGSRPCLYGQGRVAHVMFRHNGHAVSLFMLPGTKRPEQFINVLGHEAAIWCTGNRTFVLIAQEPRAEMQRLATYVHAALR